MLSARLVPAIDLKGQVECLNGAIDMCPTGIWSQDSSLSSFVYSKSEI